jgi:hypothetical protein
MGGRVVYIDSFVGEAWWDSRALFFCFAEEDRELFDRGHGNVAAVVTGKKCLSEDTVSQVVVLWWLAIGR